MSFHCSIGIVTYLGRFESHFKPLIRKLYSLFPDYDTIVFINGHHDSVKQIDYLKKITTFLKGYPNIRYLTNLEHQAIAQGWNQIAWMASCDRILMLNDDIIFNLEFRHNFESLPVLPDFFIINGSWSHFVISKEIMKTVGWFDERFVGMGCEDHDYSFRLARRGIPLETIAIHGIYNQSASQDDPGWSNFSGIDQIVGRHSEVNREFLKKKWFWSDFGPVPEEGSFKVWYPAYNLEWSVAPKADIEDMPEFYPLSCLNNFGDCHYRNGRFFRQLLAKGCSYINSFYWSLRIRLGVRFRRF